VTLLAVAAALGLELRERAARGLGVSAASFVVSTVVAVAVAAGQRDDGDQTR
jgi:hypothetical protein